LRVSGAAGPRCGGRSDVTLRRGQRVEPGLVLHGAEAPEHGQAPAAAGTEVHRAVGRRRAGGATGARNVLIGVALLVGIDEGAEAQEQESRGGSGAGAALIEQVQINPLGEFAGLEIPRPPLAGFEQVGLIADDHGDLSGQLLDRVLVRRVVFHPADLAVRQIEGSELPFADGFVLVLGCHLAVAQAG